MYYIGLDLGQATDYTALCVVEKCYDEPYKKCYDEPYKKGPTNHQLRHLERVDLGTTYPAIVDKVQEMVSKEPLIDKYQIIADATGCGRPVIDLLRKAKLSIIPVVITGGHKVTFDEGYYNVPKRELVSNLQVLMGNKRLKFSDALPDIKTLVNELLNFQMTINEKANDTYEGRQGIHDDMVLSVALAAWYSELYGHVWEKKTAHTPNPWTGLF